MWIVYTWYRTAGVVCRWWTVNPICMRTGIHTDANQKNFASWQWRENKSNKTQDIKLKQNRKTKNDRINSIISQMELSHLALASASSKTCAQHTHAAAANNNGIQFIRGTLTKHIHILFILAFVWCFVCVAFTFPFVFLRFRCSLSSSFFFFDVINLFTK